MDTRRGFLGKALGVVAAAATTKLWLPPVSTVLAEPERKVFLPPAAGWPTSPFADDTGGYAMPGDFRWRNGVSAYDYIKELDSQFLNPYSGLREEWDLTIRWHPRPGQTVEWQMPDAEVHGPGYQCFMEQYLEESYFDNALEVTERWTGRGSVPQSVIDGLVAGKDGRIEMTRRLVPVWPNRYIVG